MEKSTDFYEIYEYYYQPLWTTKPFKISILIIALTLLVTVIFFTVRYFIKKKQLAALFPWEWALVKLQKLLPQNCSTKNDFKKFYFELTFIIKNYLQKRYDWNTLDKTDQELIIYLENKNFDKPLLNNLKQMMEGAMEIKFANEYALKTQAETDLKLAYEIVEKTKEYKETTSVNHAQTNK
jgi:hypothetical protein